jgi:hypothetical protein
MTTISYGSRIARISIDGRPVALYETISDTFGGELPRRREIRAIGLVRLNQNEARISARGISRIDAQRAFLSELEQRQRPI